MTKGSSLVPEPDLLLKIEIRLFDRSSYRLWGGRYCDGENWGGGGADSLARMWSINGICICICICVLVTWQVGSLTVVVWGSRSYLVRGPRSWAPPASSLCTTSTGSASSLGAGWSTSTCRSPLEPCCTPAYQSWKWEWMQEQILHPTSLLVRPETKINRWRQVITEDLLGCEVGDQLGDKSTVALGLKLAMLLWLLDRWHHHLVTTRLGTLRKNKGSNIVKSKF